MRVEIDSDEPLTISVPEAGKLLGAGRDAAYRAARAGRGGSQVGFMPFPL
jgi:hypothetical protein